MSRKPSPGVCGKCGRARVRPTPSQVEAALDRADAAGNPDVWVEGHRFVECKLTEVRCIDHEPRKEWG
jgi:hypothetical protein